MFWKFPVTQQKNISEICPLIWVTKNDLKKKKKKYLKSYNDKF